MSVRRDERGFVLITAMIVLSVFMVLTVAIVTIVDVQTSQTGHERSGEAAFNLAQSALQAEAYQLQANWPATAAQALPTPCNQSTPQETGCEGAALTQQLQAPTPGPDYAHATWSAQAFEDNGSAYSPSMVGTTPTWANGYNSMWVRAQATANGQTRTVVEKVTRRLQTVSLPEDVVTAGGIKTNSSGTPAIIKAQDPASGIVGPVDVRCGIAGSTPPQTNCMDWAKPTQLDPQYAYQAGYVDPSGTSSSLTTAQITSFTQEARADHTLYNIGATYDAGAIPTCPPDGWPVAPAGGWPADPAGQTYPVVVVEGASATPCPIKTDWVTNGPGVLLYLQGSVSVGTPGNPNFYGVIYMANENQGAMPPAGSPCTAAQLSAPPLVTLAGSGTVTGAIFVDGCGVVSIQDNGDALNFSPNALQPLQTYGTATPAPGTFRVVSQ